MLVPIALAAVLVMFMWRSSSRDTAPEEEEEGGLPCLILDLPSEVLERVLANVDPEELVAASQVCIR